MSRIVWGNPARTSTKRCKNFHIVGLFNADNEVVKRGGYANEGLKSKALKRYSKLHCSQVGKTSQRWGQGKFVTAGKGKHLRARIEQGPRFGGVRSPPKPKLVPKAHGHFVPAPARPGEVRSFKVVIVTKDSHDNVERLLRRKPGWQTKDDDAWIIGMPQPTNLSKVEIYLFLKESDRILAWSIRPCSVSSGKCDECEVANGTQVPRIPLYSSALNSREMALQPQVGHLDGGNRMGCVDPYPRSPPIISQTPGRGPAILLNLKFHVPLSLVVCRL